MPATKPDTELLLLAADSVAQLLARAQTLGERAGEVSLGALSAQCAEQLDLDAPLRAAVVARGAADLRFHLAQLDRRGNDARATAVAHDATRAAWWSGHGQAETPARVGFAFPGNGVQRLDMGRALVDAFPWARLMVDQAQQVVSAAGGPQVVESMFRARLDLDEAEEQRLFEQLSFIETGAPAIMLTSALWARYLQIIGVKPAAVCGHSQGEQGAFYAAGAIDFEALMQLAVYMSRAGSPDYSPGAAGTMAMFSCSADAAGSLLAGAGGYAVVAAINGPTQVTVAGEVDAIERARKAALERDIDVRMLPVSNAFHSRLVAAGLRYMRSNCPAPPPVGETRAVLLSGVDASPVAPDVSPLDYFCDMGLGLIDFDRTARALAAHVDLVIEVGPGRALSGLIDGIDPGYLCLPIEPKPLRTRALHIVAAALFAHRTPVKWPIFFKGQRRAWASAQP